MFNAIKDMFATNPQPSEAPPSAPMAPDNKALSAPNQGVDGKALGAEVIPPNPLDIYTKMYEDSNKGTDLVAPSFKLDPKILASASASMDFTKAIPAELMEKALSGDAKSVMEAINSAARASYTSSLEHLTALTDTHLNNRADYESRKVSEGVKTQLTSQALSDAPNYSHPVVKAELNRVAAMFSKANPDHSAKQIAEAAQAHIRELSAALNPATKVDQAQEGQMDWSKYLS